MLLLAEDKLTGGDNGRGKLDGSDPVVGAEPSVASRSTMSSYTLKKVSARAYKLHGYSFFDT
jgi:hypothetical protein